MMLSLLLASIQPEPALNLDLNNETYAEMAREIFKQAGGQTISAGASLNGRKVILLCEDQPFSELRKASEELLDLQWTKTESGWRMDRAPEAVAHEKAMLDAEAKLAEQALRDMLPFVSSPDTHLPPPKSLKGTTLQDCYNVQVEFNALFKQIYESKDLTARLVRGEPLMFSSNPADGLIETLIFNTVGQPTVGRVRLQYRRATRVIEILHCVSAEDAGADMVRNIPRSIRLSPDKTQMPDDSVIARKWPVEAPAALKDVPVSAEIALPKSGYEGRYFSLGDHAGYLHQATGAPLMMEGSRQAVTVEIPKAQDASFYLNSLVHLSRKAPRLQGILGVKAFGPWISAKAENYWHLSDELPEEAVQTLERKWANGGRLDISDFAMQFKGITEEQEAAFGNESPPQLMTFPSVPLGMKPGALFRFWNSLPVAQRQAMTGQGGLAAALAGNGPCQTFLQGIQQQLVYIPMPSDTHLAIWKNSFDWRRCHFAATDGFFEDEAVLIDGAHRSTLQSQLRFYTVTLAAGGRSVGGLGIPLYMKKRR